jgi:hypothetical protein
VLAQNNWLGNTPGLESDWGTATNWSLGTVPQTNADIVAFLGTGSATVNLAAPYTIQVLGFDATAQAYTITGQPLILDSNQTVSSEVIVVAAGAALQQINVPVVATNSNTAGTIYCRLGSGTNLTLAGGLTMTKEFQVNDQPANSAIPGGTLRINGGHLQFDGNMNVREHATVTLNPATVGGSSELRCTDNNARVNLENPLPGFAGRMVIGTTSSTTHNGRIYLTGEINMPHELRWNAGGTSGTNTADQTYGVDILGPGKVAEHSGPMVFRDLSSGITGTNATYKIDTSDDVLIVSGTISGNAAGYTTPRLQKLGTGIAIFTAANTYPFITEVRAGTLLVNNTSGSGVGGGTFDIYNTSLGGGGNGSISGTLNVRGGATFTVGGDRTAAGFGLGTFTAGTVNFLGTGAGGCTVNFQLKSPTEHDRVVTAGTMQIQGGVNLVVTTVPGFAPAPGQSYDLLDWGTRTGTGTPAARLQLPVLPLGLGWDTTTFATDGRISIIQTGWSYALWLAANFTSAEQADPQISGETADVEGDGETNLMEYAMATPPKSATPLLSRSGPIVNVGGTDYFGIKFRRPKNILDVTYTVQTSTDLTAAPAFSDVLTPLGPIIDNGDGTETVVWYDATPTLPAPEQRYIRIKITKAP